MKAYVLDNGWLECDANWMVGNSTLATLQQKACQHKWIKIPVYAVLIDHPDGKIAQSRRNRLLRMPLLFWVRLLVGAIFLAASIDKILDPGAFAQVVYNYQILPDSFINDVYVHRKDFEYGQTLIHLSPNPANHGAYVKADLEVPVKQYHLVDEDFELVPGVEVITLPGHTPGILGIIVHLEKEGTLIFPQDALYTRENYGPPAKASGIVYDSLAFFNSVEKVRRYAKKYNAKVMFSHDMDFFETMKLAPGYYE